jgi:Mg2+-importing ATPase
LSRRILLSSTLGFWQEYSAGVASARLAAKLKLRTWVIRDGVKQAIDTDRLVPGDIVELSAGDLIPADGVILESTDLFVTQSAR